MQETECHDWGYRIQGFRVALITLAGNYWIICKDAPELCAMNNFWTKCLERYGWSSPLEECWWCTSWYTVMQGDGILDPALVKDYIIQRKSPQSMFCVLLAPDWLLINTIVLNWSAVPLNYVGVSLSTSLC